MDWRGKSNFHLKTRHVRKIIVGHDFLPAFRNFIIRCKKWTDRAKNTAKCETSRSENRWSWGGRESWYFFKIGPGTLARFGLCEKHGGNGESWAWRIQGNENLLTKQFILFRSKMNLSIKLSRTSQILSQAGAAGLRILSIKYQILSSTGFQTPMRRKKILLNLHSGLASARRDHLRCVCLFRYVLKAF